MQNLTNTSLKHMICSWLIHLTDHGNKALAKNEYPQEGHNDPLQNHNFNRKYK